MSIEQNKASIRRFYEQVVNARNIDLADELIAADFNDHAAEEPGLEQFKSLYGKMISIFEGLHITVDDLIAEGDKVAAYVTTHAVQVGKFRGFPPSKKEVVFSGVDIFRFENGKVVERWAVRDFLGMLQQAGHAKQKA